MKCIDFHILTLLLIMLSCGSFGGYLNYLHSFDISEADKKQVSAWRKYVFLGMGSALVVPLLLNMIQSNLITDARHKLENYLIFAGFCLIAAIFSRRFISTIGERVLELATNANKTAKENTQKIQTTQQELSSAKERIEDVKLAVDINNAGQPAATATLENQTKLLIELADSYVAKTSIPDYASRLKLKAEMGRKMGEIIIRNTLPKKMLIEQHASEGMCVAIAYAVQLRPDAESLTELNNLSKIATSLFAKYAIVIAYQTLLRNSLVEKTQMENIYSIIEGFRSNADEALLRNIDATVNFLKALNTDI